MKNKMKNKLLYLVLLLISFNLYSQQRENEAKIEFDKVGDSIVEATGWTFYSYNGEWSEIKKENGVNRCGEINFYKIFFSEITYNSKKYYSYNVVSLDGTFKYPAIQKGFYTYKIITSYLFKEKEYGKLKNYKSAKSKQKVTTYIDNENIGEKELNKLRDNIVFYLKKKITSSRNTIKVKKESDEVIRFILPLKEKYKSLEKDWGFDKKYFEVSKSNYDKLFK